MAFALATLGPFICLERFETFQQRPNSVGQALRNVDQQLPCQGATGVAVFGASTRRIFLQCKTSLAAVLHVRWVQLACKALEAVCNSVATQLG
eukprot:433299-Amphidinium_carterae.1